MPSAVRVKHTAQEAGVPIVTGLGPRNSCKDGHPPDAIVPLLNWPMPAALSGKLRVRVYHQRPIACRLHDHPEM